MSETFDDLSKLEKALAQRDANAARIQELESELASCRECRANLDCLSRGQPKDTAK